MKAFSSEGFALNHVLPILRKVSSAWMGEDMSELIRVMDTLRILGFIER